MGEGRGRRKVEEIALITDGATSATEWKQHSTQCSPHPQTHVTNVWRSKCSPVAREIQFLEEW